MRRREFWRINPAVGRIDGTRDARVNELKAFPSRYAEKQRKTDVSSTTPSATVITAYTQYNQFFRNYTPMSTTKMLQRTLTSHYSPHPPNSSTRVPPPLNSSSKPRPHQTTSASDTQYTPVHGTPSAEVPKSGASRSGKPCPGIAMLIGLVGP
jgi:hypothetical protein